jgi:hypothetical protein
VTAGAPSRLSALLQLDENLIYYPRGIRSDLAELAVDREPANQIIRSIQIGGNWNPPLNVDLPKFALEIWMLKENYQEWERLDSDAEAKRRYKRLLKLHRHLKSAVSLYVADGPWLDRELTWMWRERFNFIRALEDNAIESSSHGLHELRDGMSLLAARIKVLSDGEAEMGRDRKSAYPLVHFTPTRLLALELERIGRDYLGLKATFGRYNNGEKDGQVTGPFIRFSTATIEALGISLTPATIAKALQQNRGPIARKRRVTTSKK